MIHACKVMDQSVSSVLLLMCQNSELLNFVCYIFQSTVCHMEDWSR